MQSYKIRGLEAGRNVLIFTPSSVPEFYKLILIEAEGLNPLVPNRYQCTYILFLFVRSICRKMLALTLLTHKSPKHAL